jgi:hypothetical protein
VHRLSRVLALGLLVAAAACAHRAGAAGNSGGPQQSASVRVHVINHYKTEMEIIAAGSGTSQRLGLVAPGTERDFEIPQVLVISGAVSFLAQPSGYGPITRSEEVRIRSGDIVDFEIATNLYGSRATVRL